MKESRKYYSISNRNNLEISDPGIKRIDDKILFDKKYFDLERVDKWVKVNENKKVNKILKNDENIKRYDTTPEDINLINKFALVPLSKNDIESYKFYLCNDILDRDNEKFTIEVLESFQKSITGKSLLLRHDKSFIGVGLFYKTEIEIIDSVTWLKAYCYILKKEREIIDNVNAGIWRYVSIGFIAGDYKPVTDEKGNIKFWEYRNKYDNNGTLLKESEALEGSIVWLGAQFGATIRKSSDMDILSESEETAISEIDDDMVRLAYHKNINDYNFKMEKDMDEKEKIEFTIKEFSIKIEEMKKENESLSEKLKTLETEKNQIQNENKSLLLVVTEYKSQKVNEILALMKKVEILPDNEVKEEEQKLLKLSFEDMNNELSRIKRFSKNFEKPEKVTVITNQTDSKSQDEKEIPETKITNFKI